jgi:hypothetical protein
LPSHPPSLRYQMGHRLGGIACLNVAGMAAERDLRPGLLTSNGQHTGAG